MTDSLLLCVGPRDKGDEGSIGGTTRSFELFIAHLVEFNIPHLSIASNRFVGRGATLFSAVYCVMQVIKNSGRSHGVFLSGSIRGATFLAPVLRFIAGIFKLQFAFRMFGGDFAQTYQASGNLRRKVLDYGVLSAKPVFLQTKALVSEFSAVGRSVHYLPTSRPRPAMIRHARAYQRRLVFIGQIRPEKGVDQVLAFREKHGDRFVVDLYGPVMHERYENLSDGQGYRGPLKPEAVSETLTHYDVLLLPTFYTGEGYPGVIIEAMQVGLPVVTTRWQDIPEIIDDGKNGILVPAHDDDAFEKALLDLDDLNYQAMSTTALEHASSYDSSAVIGHLLATIQSCGRQT